MRLYVLDRLNIWATNFIGGSLFVCVDDENQAEERIKVVWTTSHNPIVPALTQGHTPVALIGTMAKFHTPFARTGTSTERLAWSERWAEFDSMETQTTRSPRYKNPATRRQPHLTLNELDKPRYIQK
jgi:hypothetical protein